MTACRVSTSWQHVVLARHDSRPIAGKWRTLIVKNMVWWYCLLLTASKRHLCVNQTDRHHCFIPGNIPKAGGSQILLNLVTVLWSPRNSTDTRNKLCWSKSISQGGLPLPTPNHSLATCGGPEAFTSTTFLWNVVENYLVMAGTLHPEGPLRAPYIQYK